MGRNTKKKIEAAKRGQIEDIRVFKLMYLEKSINEARLQAELKTRAITDQIEALKNERQSAKRNAELRVRNLTNEIEKMRQDLEHEYDIKMYEWGYDDTTGVLVPLPPEILQQVHQRLNLQKKVDEEKHEEDKARKSKAEETKAEERAKSKKLKPPVAEA